MGELDETRTKPSATGFVGSGKKIGKEALAALVVAAAFVAGIANEATDVLLFDEKFSTGDAVRTGVLALLAALVALAVIRRGKR